MYRGLSPHVPSSIPFARTLGAASPRPRSWVTAKRPLASAVRRYATAQADFWGGKPIALTCRDHPSPCDFRIKSLQTPRCVSVSAGLVISLPRSPVAPMASEIADAALAARLDRIKELTSELARMQADSVEARLLAERIQREIDQRKSGGAADRFRASAVPCCWLRKSTNQVDDTQMTAWTRFKLISCTAVARPLTSSTSCRHWSTASR